MSGKNTERLMDRWYELIYKKLKDNHNLLKVSEQFSELHTNQEQVAFSWKLDCIQDTIKVKEMFLGKSASKSIQLRTDGNKEFQKKNLLGSLKLYNESVRFAPVSSSELEYAMAIANRSAVLFHLKKYHDCLQDIEMALRHGYPEASQHKVYERQAKCFYFLHKQAQALESFNKAKSLLALSQLSVEKSKLCGKNLGSWIKKCKEGLKQNAFSCSGLIDPKKNSAEVFSTPDISNGPNDVFPCLSSKVDVSVEPEKGRCIKAVEEVQVGEVLAVEKPYASVLLPENYPTHCLHCLKRVLAPIPCRQCARVGFCSDACENLAWRYHVYECKHLDFLKACDIGKFGFLALRVITKTTWAQLAEFDSERCREGPPPEDDSLSNSIYGNTYFEIFHLVAHSDGRSTSDLFRRSIMAILLTKCLDGAGFFGQRSSSSPRAHTDRLLCTGSHLLRMLQVLPCNAHEISEFLQLDMDLVNSHTIEIAAAIYATFSLFNHSCDPCVTRNFYGDACVMRSIQTIPKDDEVSDNYGYVSAVTPFEERRAELKKQYYFECACGACAEKWPLYAELECRVPTLKCRICDLRVPAEAQSHPMYKCLGCGQEINLQSRFGEVFDAGACLKVGIDKMIEGDDKAALPQFMACIERLDHCVERPWQDINSCQQGIIQCYNVLQSNRRLVRK